MYLLTPHTLYYVHSKGSQALKIIQMFIRNRTSGIDWIHLYDYWREIFLCKCFMFHIEFSVKSLDL